MHAAEGGHYDAANILLKARANPKIRNEARGLAGPDNPVRRRLFRQSITNLRSLSQIGYTAFHYACRTTKWVSESVRVRNLLLDHDSTLADERVHRHRCDGCQQQPIIGKRYNCSLCGDFDLCEACWRECGHPHSMQSFTSYGATAVSVPASSGTKRGLRSISSVEELDRIAATEVRPPY